MHIGFIELLWGAPRRANRIWQARCSCGWGGTETSNKAVARQEVVKHDPFYDL